MKLEILEEYAILNNNDELTNNKIAAFDLDGTLITTKSGKKFPINKDDWKILYPDTQNIIEQLYLKKYKIIIITNQSRINVEDFLVKIKNICEILKYISAIYIALKINKYRKPMTGFWDEFIKSNHKKNFYCGDACGREGDFSNTDYKFSKNLNIKFFTPEILNSKKLKLKTPFNNTISYSPFNQIPNPYTFVPFKKEIIILCGIPGSGKTSFYKNQIEPHNYNYINYDTMCKKGIDKVINESLKNKQNIVIDNMNLTIESRKYYIQLAKSNNMQSRCIFFDISKDIAYHNMLYRHCRWGNKVIPDVVYNSARKRLTHPDKNEGFDEIIVINYINNNDPLYLKYYY